MVRDPLVEEIRRVRDAHAKRFGYDLDAIFADLKAQEQASGRQFVTLGPRKARDGTSAEHIKHG
jgi:uncharacterized protein YciI